MPAAYNRRSSETNVFGKVTRSALNVPAQGFSIYVDNDRSTTEKHSSSTVRSEKLDLDPVVTALSRQPLTEVFPPPGIQNGNFTNFPVLLIYK